VTQAAALSYADVVEGVRRAQATYAQALDNARIDELAAVFTEDGVVDLEYVGVFEGRETIRATYEGWKPTAPQRHLVSNLVVTEYTDTTASATADVVFTSLVDGAWVIGMVARYGDELRREPDGVWRFSRRATRFVGDPGMG
jgi:ketosteroid isomerase-like protein